MEDEIKLHLALRAEQLMANGKSADAAYEEAVRRFGPLTESRARLFSAARHRETRMHRTEYLSDLRQDVAFALRRLRRDRMWSVVTVLTLALGIGATTAVFSVASTLLLHAVPYPDPTHVVMIDQQPTKGDHTGLGVSMLPSARLVKDWQAAAHSIGQIAEYLDLGTVQLRESDGGDGTIKGARIARNFPAFAGVHPLIGRMFSDDEAASGAHVVLLGEGFWRERFGGETRTLGRAIWLDDSLYTVIGVLPQTLSLPRVGTAAKDVWLPLNMNDTLFGVASVARLRPGATPAMAARELDSIAARSTNVGAESKMFTTRVTPPADLVRFRDTLFMLSAAVALVLLVACANVAHLLLSRNATRQREMSIRAALGAGRARILRQLLTESLVITFAATGCGVLLGWIGLRLIVAAAPPALPELKVTHLDATTLAASVVAAIAIGVAFGTLGAWQSRRGTHDALKANAGSVSLSKRADRMRSVFIVSEMAISAMLLVGATLLIRSVRNLQQTNLGFDPHGLYAVTLPLPRSRYPDAASQAALASELEQRLARAPGVRAVSQAGAPPGYFFFLIGALEVEGEAPAPKATTAFIDHNPVEPTYFATMGIPILEGRAPIDTTKGAREVAVNASFAYRHWRKGEAVGHRVRVSLNGDGSWMRVSGVVGDAATGGPLHDPTAPILYTNAYGGGNAAFLVRLADGTDATAILRGLIRQREPALRPTINSVDAIVANSISGPRFVMVLLTVFTVLAVALASIGLYGVMSYTVAQRTREIGIRVALGAPARRIARLVVGRGVVLAALGGVVGLVGAHWGTALIEHQLHGVQRSDVLSFTIGAAALLLTAIVACIVPTSRAISVDPVTAIRAE